MAVVPDWRDMPRQTVRKYLTSLAMVAVYHAGMVVPVPGLAVPAAELARLVDTYALVRIHDYLIAGGGVRIGVGLLILGFLPYVEAASLISALKPFVPYFRPLEKGGTATERRYETWTRIVAVVLAVLNAMAAVRVFHAGGSFWAPVAWLVLGALIATGCVIAIDKRGVGSGTGVLTASSVAASVGVWVLEDAGEQVTGGIARGALAGVLALAIFWAILVTYSTYRELPVTQVRTGRTMPMPIPLDYAVGDAAVRGAVLVGLIATGAHYLVPGSMLERDLQDPSSLLFTVVLVPCMALFSWLIFTVKFDPYLVSRQLHEGAQFIQGLRPLKTTEDFLRRVTRKVMLVGIGIKAAILLAIWVVLRVAGMAGEPVLLYSTVAVTIALGREIAARTEAEILTNSYEGLISTPRLGGARRRRR